MSHAGTRYFSSTITIYHIYSSRYELPRRQQAPQKRKWVANQHDVGRSKLACIPAASTDSCAWWRKPVRHFIHSFVCIDKLGGQHKHVAADVWAQGWLRNRMRGQARDGTAQQGGKERFDSMEGLVSIPRS